MAYARYVETIRALVRGDVEFVVVGMAAAILQGTPSLTLDLDIVHKRTPEEVKQRAGRAKDMAVMPVLEATLRESRRLGLK